MSRATMRLGVATAICLAALGAYADTAAAPAVDPVALDGALDGVLRQPEYTWRQPRVVPEKPPDYTLLGGLMRRISETLEAATRRVFETAKRLYEWLRRLHRRLFPPRQPAQLPGGSTWVSSLLLVFLGGALLALLWLLVRLWLQGRRESQAVQATAVEAVPDLEDETLTPDDQPEERWLAMARELLARKEYRLALRALFLGTLASLSRRNLIRVARFKSNRDYENELRSRNHVFPELVAAFAENRTIFESVWYGAHPVTPERLEQFENNREKVQRHGLET